METKVKKTIKTDVAVIGGGTAGVMAAVSAADAGAEALLVEKNGMLGGTMTAASVNFPGLFYAWGKRILGGHAYDMILSAMENGRDTVPPVSYSPEKHWEQQYRINTFSLCSLFDLYCERYGVKVLLHTMLAAVSEDENGVTLLLCCKEGLVKVEAKALVDCTGDANAVSLAGYKTEKSENCQPATSMVFLEGYDPSTVGDEALLSAYNEASAENKLPELLSFAEFKGAFRRKKADIHIPSCGAETSEGKTAVEQSARKSISAFIDLIRRLPDCENTKAASLPAECGVRESVRIVGEHKITVKEYKEAFLYDDAVCYAYYPIDLHIKGGVTPQYLDDGKIPTVPLRALIPKDSAKLLAAGRCVSSDTLANSALRVQVPAMGMGQAAGVAAALVSRLGGRVKDLPTESIREELIRQGAIVPSASFPKSGT